MPAIRKRTRSKPKPRRRQQQPKPAVASDSSLTPAGPGDKLTDEQKRAVVQRLAMFDTPQEVQQWVREEMGIEITRQSIHYYDPTHEPKPAVEWCQLFDATREAFLKSTAEIPVANRSVRIRRLERLALKAETMRNYPLAKELYEQIAKEVGDIYTNKRNIGVSGELKGGVLAVPVPIGAEEWGRVASAQQSELTRTAREAAAAALAHPAATNGHPT